MSRPQQSRGRQSQPAVALFLSFLLLLGLILVQGARTSSAAPSNAPEAADISFHSFCRNRRLRNGR